MSHQRLTRPQYLSGPFPAGFAKFTKLQDQDSPGKGGGGVEGDREYYPASRGLSYPHETDQSAHNITSNKFNFTMDAKAQTFDSRFQLVK